MKSGDLTGRGRPGGGRAVKERSPLDVQGLAGRLGPAHTLCTGSVLPGLGKPERSAMKQDSLAWEWCLATSLTVPMSAYISLAGGGSLSHSHCHSSLSSGGKSCPANAFWEMLGPKGAFIDSLKTLWKNRPKKNKHPKCFTCRHAAEDKPGDFCVICVVGHEIWGVFLLHLRHKILWLAVGDQRPGWVQEKKQTWFLLPKTLTSGDVVNL